MKASALAAQPAQTSVTSPATNPTVPTRTPPAMEITLRHFRRGGRFPPGMTEIAADLRALDPAAYAVAIGLVPDDCYGFLPVDHDEITPYLFLYRDRAAYAKARQGLGGEPRHVKNYGPVRVEPTQEIEIDATGVSEMASGDVDEMLRIAQQMAEGNLAAGFGSSAAAPPAPAGPDPEKLARLEKLRASGAVTEAEYMGLAAEALGPTGAPEPPASPGAEPGGRIVSHRLYPGLHTRSSGRQLNYFLPRYRDTVGLRSDDTYGVLPRGTRQTVETSSTEWDDYWIVYRDRPEYEAGREEWGRTMNKKGNWPEIQVFSGVGEAPGLTHDPGGVAGKVKLEKDGSRRRLVKRETGADLGDSLREKIEKWGYEPESSFGVSPNYTNRSIYFAWRK